MFNKIKQNKKGFTLAELLIVVAIIAVLVAISIPIFTSQLHKSKAATDQANARSLYADAQSTFLADGADGVTTYPAGTATFNLSDGQTIKLQTGTIACSVDETKGVTVTYTCSEEDDHDMTFGGSNVSAK